LLQNFRQALAAHESWETSSSKCGI